MDVDCARYFAHAIVPRIGSWNTTGVLNSHLSETSINTR